MLTANRCSDAMACKSALEVAGYGDLGVSPGDGDGSGLACTSIGAAREGRRTEIRVYTYGREADGTTYVRAKATSVMVAVAHRKGETVDVEAVDRVRAAMAAVAGGSDLVRP